MPIAPWLRPPIPKRSNIRAEVIALDPNWPRDNDYIVEYEFPQPRGANLNVPDVYEDGKRLFKANYKNRGAYGE